MHFHNDIKMDFEKMFDSDDVDLFEKSCNLTQCERLTLAAFVQCQINKCEDEIAILSKNRMKAKKLPDQKASEKLTLDNENKQIKDTKFVKSLYVNLYKEITNTNTDVGMQALSEKLSTLADRMRLTEEGREVFIETIKVKTCLLNLHNALHGLARCDRYAGSQAEGTASLNAQTDTDILLVNPLIRIYKVCQNPETTMPYLRMIEDIKTPAGYIKLQLFHKGHAVYGNRGREYYQSFFIHKLIIDKNRVFLSNEFTNEYLNSLEKMEYEKHGPAVTLENSIGLTVDHVHAYLCEALPDQVTPWLKRKRRYDWPCKKTIKLFKQMGCAIVAIGHQNSQEQKFQWRLSFTNQEMYLMHNLNMTQYKCYVILKYFKTCFIKNFHFDSVCSYHLKTVLFYTLENSDPSIWQPKYLAYVVLKCLHNIKEWVGEMNCPNYFIPRENMFETKLNQEDKENLSFFLSTQFDWQYSLRLLSHAYESEIPCQSDLLQFSSYHITQELNSIFLEFMVCMENKGYPQNVLIIDKIIQCLEIFTEDNKSALCPIVSGYTAFPELLILLLFMRYAGTHDLKPRIQQFLNEMPTFEDIYPILINYSAVRSAFFHVKIFFHAQVASIILMGCRKSIEQNHRMPFEIINHQDQLAGTARFVNAMLKQASILYIDGHHELAEDSLKEAVKMKLVLPALPVACLHTAECLREKVKRNTGTSFHVDLLQKLEPYQENVDYLIINTLTCLQFDSMETLMAPRHLQYEALRTFGTPPLPRSKDLNYVIIDPFVFLHYLRYKNYEAMDDKPRKNLELRSLDKMMFYNLHETKLKHFDTALNCLGHIYVTKGWHRLAISCFRKSMVEESLYNAAKWHIMFLLCR